MPPWDIKSRHAAGYRTVWEPSCTDTVPAWDTTSLLPSRRRDELASAPQVRLGRNRAPLAADPPRRLRGRRGRACRRRYSPAREDRWRAGQGTVAHADRSAARSIPRNPLTDQQARDNNRQQATTGKRQQHATDNNMQQTTRGQTNRQERQRPTGNGQHGRSPGSFGTGAMYPVAPTRAAHASRYMHACRRTHARTYAHAYTHTRVRTPTGTHVRAHVRARTAGVRAAGALV
jgi:hypothetical protein